MYGIPPKLSLKPLAAGWRSEQTHDKTIKQSGNATSLTTSLTQSLQQGLYVGLFPGCTAPAKTGALGPAESRMDLPDDPIGPAAGPVSPGQEIQSETRLPSSATMVRKVALLPGESVSYTFSPDKGLNPESLEQGQLLVLTNRRVIAFGTQNEGASETVLMPVEEVKAVAVVAGRRSKGTLFQGGLMVIAAVFFYVLLAYWLTGRIDGPTVPIIRMDLVAFVVFLAILSGVGLLAQVYFSKPDGEVTFQGDGVKVTFPFRGDNAEDEIYQVVNSAFAARQSVVAQFGPRDSGVDYSGLDAR